MKYFKRWNAEGEPFYVDEKGNLVSEEIAKRNLVESDAGRRMNVIESSAADVASAKTMTGHLVRARGSGDLYRVASAGEKLVTLHGPIGKGGTKSISPKRLVDEHEI